MLSVRRERVGNACGIQISCVKLKKKKPKPKTKTKTTNKETNKQTNKQK